MTQTTAVRVESILESHLHLIPLMVGVDGESADIGGMTEAARKIAAEIDALRDEMAVILRERNDAHLALAERTRERDEALAEVESCRKAYAQMRSTEDEWKRDTLAAHKAEVERLRPAAEAWEAYDDYMTCPETEEAAKFPVWVAAHRAAKGAQAARAAKESQP